PAEGARRAPSAFSAKSCQAELTLVLNRPRREGAGRGRDRADPAAGGRASVGAFDDKVHGVSTVAASQYRVKREKAAGESRFIVVGPSGIRLYWFADRASAEADVRSLQRAGPNRLHT